MKSIRIVVLSLFALFLLDFLVFRTGQYLLPNESPWNTNHFFNFVYEAKRIKSSAKTKPRILVVGSSIAYYSIDARKLELEILRQTGKDVEVKFLAYAGNSPLYVYLLFSWIEDLKPDLVVYPINFIDYRIHRSYVLDPNRSFFDMPEEDLWKDSLTFGEAPQGLWVFPWQTLRASFAFMSWEEKARYFLSGVFHFYRTKDYFFTNIQNIYQHRFGKNTSYHAYAGYDVPELVNFMGWTGKRFSFPPLPEYQKGRKGFWLEITPFLLTKGELSVRFQQVRQDKIVSQTISVNKPGWNLFALNPEFFDSTELIQAELSRTWKAFEATQPYLDYHYDEMGVRLPQTFGLVAPRQNEQYLRALRSEDIRYVSMSDSDYEKYFQYRLLQDLEKRPGIGYLVALEKAKKRIRSEPFSKKFHFSYLEKIAEKAEEKGIPLLFVNNPENPVSLRWYEDSNWYKDHLLFLSNLERRKVHFVDLKNQLRAQDFSDFHHFTYLGMERMNPIYASLIGNLFPK